MASIEELKGRLLQAADIIDEAAGYVGAAANKIDDAKVIIAHVFEGTGRADLMDVLGHVDRTAIEMSNVLVEALATAVRVRDVVAMM